LNLLPIPAQSTADDPISNLDGNDEEDENEEKEVLIPSDTYDGLICAACVRRNAFLASKAGTEGWMMVEPTEDGSLEVIGRPAEQEVKAPETITSTEEAYSAESIDGIRKRSEEEADGPEAKKVKVKGSDHTSVAESQSSWRWKGKGDVFLAHGVREGLKSTLSARLVTTSRGSVADVSLKLPKHCRFHLRTTKYTSLLKMLKTVCHKPYQNADLPDETIEQVTERVVGALPRVQAIEALHGYQIMK
jgi:E3 ubiquitin-protein ligase UBR7